VASTRVVDTGGTPVKIYPAPVGEPQYALPLPLLPRDFIKKMIPIPQKSCRILPLQLLQHSSASVWFADSRRVPICMTTAVCSKMEISVYGEETRRRNATCTSQLCYIYIYISCVIFLQVSSVTDELYSVLHIGQCIADRIRVDMCSALLWATHLEDARVSSE